MADALQTGLGLWSGAVSTSAHSFNTFALDATTDRVEYIFQAREAATITKLGFRHASTTGTSPSYTVSLQGVDGTGIPDGTIKGGGSPASKVINPTSLGWASSTWYWVTLDNSYTCTRGEFLAIVVEYSSGTIDISNNVLFTSSISNSELWNLPYAIQKNGGTRTRQTTLPCYGYASNSKAYGYPVQAFSAPSYGSTTGGADEYALAWSLPTGWGDTYKVAGVRVQLGPAASNTFKVILYSGTTVLQSLTVDQDHVSNSSRRFMECYFPETTLETLTFGTTYRIGFQPQSTSTLLLQSMDMNAASDWDAWPGGQNFWHSTRLDAGSWTDDTTKRLNCGIILDDFTEPGGIPRGVLHSIGSGNY